MIIEFPAVQKEDKNYTLDGKTEITVSDYSYMKDFSILDELSIEEIEYIIFYDYGRVTRRLKRIEKNISNLLE